MAARGTIRIPMGGGLDRESGVMVAQSTRPRDIRDVYFRHGRVEARKGTTERLAVSGSCISQAHALRSRNTGVALGWNRSDGVLTAYLLSSDGTLASTIGTRLAFASGEADEPRHWMAESYGKVFVAHDEPSILDRQPTWYYDPFGVSEINDLQADLFHDGAASDVLFRGVAAHLNYLVGWGYGTEADKAAANVVRVSLPGQPTVFDPNHYVLAGNPGEPVLSCYSLGRPGLLMFKPTETYLLGGYSSRTFRVGPAVDARFGLLAAHAAVVVDGACFFWSESGPRVTTGGPSTDLALPLDLDGPDPEELAAEGDSDYAFAEYLPKERIVLFMFGSRGYALSIRNRDQPEWEYVDHGPFTMMCSYRLYSGVPEVSGPSPGFPDVGTIDNLTSDSARVHYTNNDAVGTEAVEVWVKEEGNSWSQVRTTDFNGDGQDFDPFVDLDGLTPGQFYDIALRYRLFSQYSADYEGATPDDWAALTSDPDRAGSFNIFLSTPTVQVLGWQRNSSTQEQITIKVSGLHANADLKIFRSEGEFGFITGTLIATIPAATHGGGTFTYTDLSDDEGLGDPNDWGEKFYKYAAHQETDDSVSGLSTPLGRWAGPDMPTALEITDVSFFTNEPPAPTTLNVDIVWMNSPDADEDSVTELWGQDPSSPGFTKLIDIGFPGESGSVVFTNQLEAEVRIRHKQTKFTVDDFSDFTDPVSTEDFEGGS